MIEVLCFIDGYLCESIEYPDTTTMSELGGRFCNYERFVQGLRKGDKVCMCYEIEPHTVFYMIDCDF